MNILKHMSTSTLQKKISAGPWLAVILFLFTACVGTIEDAKLEKTKTATSKVEKLPFSGLADIKAVSHDKVEVNFFPASGNPEDITYEIYVNNSESPIFVSAVSLAVNPKGKLVYSVSGLLVNTYYSFSVSAKNNKTGAKSDAGKSLSTTTFANITADFEGLATLRLPAGIAGQNSVQVEWVPAKTTGSTFSPKNADPVAYEIIVIGETGGPENLNNSAYTGTDRAVSVIPNPIPDSPQLSSEKSRVMSGLISGKKYYFQVRAIHKGYVLFGGPTKDPAYKREENNKFLAITTRTASGTFDFEPTAVKVKNPDGELALTSLDVVWDQATGDFDHYRIYKYRIPDGNDPATEPDRLTNADINLLNVSPLNYTRVDADKIFVRLNNLDSYRNYQVKMVCCANTACDEVKRIGGDAPAILKPTYPKITPFDGIDHLDHPRDEATTNTIHAVFNAPVTASGYITDMKLYCYNGATDASPAVLYFLDGALNGAHLAGATFISLFQVPAYLPSSGSVILAGGEVFTYTSKDIVLNRLISTTDTLGAGYASGVSVNWHVVGKPGCTGVKRTTPSPTLTASWTIFEEISIDNISAGTGTPYCFSMVPIIDGDNTQGFVDIEDLSAGIVKCIVPEIKTPNLQEFPGKDPVCDVVNRSIKVKWSLPSSGMYNGFHVFWKLNDGTAFKFGEAMALNPAYLNRDAILDTAVDFTIDNSLGADGLLTPGQRYYTGVLAYLDAGMPLTRYYSEPNLNSNDCLIPLPVGEFEEWTEVFAVGPKVDGLVPLNQVTGKSQTLIETLDESTVPVEVVMDPADVTGQTVNADYYLELGQITGAGHVFNGVFGKKDGNAANTKFAYSNTGMVRLSFKDVKFYSGTKTMKDLILEYEKGYCTDAVSTDYFTCTQAGFSWQIQTGTNACPHVSCTTAKSARKYGYKVFRSSDNKLTWNELTHSAFDYQSGTNSGLVRSGPVLTQPRINVPSSSTDVVTFTDYSVKHVDPKDDTTLVDKNVERARVYWYKIVAVFNGTPLPWTNSDNFIKVTLPPPNMALVHRKMANRTMCRELGRAIDKGVGKHYSCAYNGMGASGLSLPWNAGQTVYDIGGDLLVDRFELSCNMGRGDNIFPSNSDYDPGTLDVFAGLTSDYLNGSPGGSRLKGCAGTEDSVWLDDEYEPLLNAPALGGGGAATDLGKIEGYRRVRQGDCFGRGGIDMAGSTCADDTKTQKVNYVFPGSIGRTSNCQANAPGTYYGVVDLPGSGDGYLPNYDEGVDGLNNFDGYRFQKKQMQSEFGAVYYHRIDNASLGGYTQMEWPAPQGYLRKWAQLNGGSCFINLPFVNNHPNVGGAWTARWIGNNTLVRNHLSYSGTGTGVGSMTLINRTLGSILADKRFYDSATTVTAPASTFTASNRFDLATTTIGRIISTNNAKLPPLGNLSQVDVYNLCQQYKVDVGTYDEANNIYYTLLDTLGAKRIMTKKEFNVISAWPDINSNALYSGSINSYDATMVQTLEDGSYNHPRPLKVLGALVNDDTAGCNDSSRTFGGVDMPWDGLIGPRFPSRPGHGSPVLFGGSSGVDPAGFDVNSGRCVSKFGIQDLVGNIMETVADQFNCFFGADSDEMWLGPPGGTTLNSIDMEVSYLGSGYAGAGMSAPGVNSGGNRWLYNWQYDNVALKAFVIPGTQTGQCSSIQAGSDRSLVQALVGGTNPMASVFDSANAPNFQNASLILQLRTFAPELILDARIGDGQFWDFGQKNIGPPLSLKDVLRLKGLGANHNSHYFNVALGMPVRCTGAFGEGCGPDSDDNMQVTTTAFTTYYPSLTGPFEIPDFPTGNGDFFNDGLRDISYYAAWASPNAFGSPFNYVSSVNPNADTNFYTGAPDDTWVVSTADGVIDNKTAETAYWTVSRSDPLYMTAGGSAATASSGRYYGYLQGNSQDSQSYTYDRGGRCIIKINTTD